MKREFYFFKTFNCKLKSSIYYLKNRFFLRSIFIFSHFIFFLYSTIFLLFIFRVFIARNHTVAIFLFLKKILILFTSSLLYPLFVYFIISSWRILPRIIYEKTFFIKNQYFSRRESNNVIHKQIKWESSFGILPI